MNDDDEAMAEQMEFLAISKMNVVEITQFCIRLLGEIDYTRNSLINIQSKLEILSTNGNFINAVDLEDFFDTDMKDGEVIIGVQELRNKVMNMVRSLYKYGDKETKKPAAKKRKRTTKKPAAISPEEESDINTSLLGAFQYVDETMEEFMEQIENGELPIEEEEDENDKSEKSIPKEKPVKKPRSKKGPKKKDNDTDGGAGE
jgi:hypothetical protein